MEALNKNWRYAFGVLYGPENREIGESWCGGSNPSVSAYIKFNINIELHEYIK